MQKIDARLHGLFIRLLRRLLLSVRACTPVFPVHQQHAEALAIVAIEMLVMHFMRPSDGAHVGITATGKPFKPLVNDHIMNEKVGEAVSHYAEADGLHPPGIFIGSEIDQQHTGYGEDDEERIVLLEESGPDLVMVLMEIPEEAVHDVAVRQPGNAFHYNECGYQYADICEGHHA